MTNKKKVEQLEKQIDDAIQTVDDIITDLDRIKKQKIRLLLALSG